MARLAGRCRCVSARAVPACAALLFAFGALARLSAQLTPPTAAKLAMKSVPQVPNATAVYLLREELTDEHAYEFSVHYRIKILTEGGKDLANVELAPIPDNSRLEDFQARTIEPDGTIVPFTGKPGERFVAKFSGASVKVKWFSLPQVQIGSILEYRYRVQSVYSRPEWLLQSSLFAMTEHFHFRPSDLLPNISWTPILPSGATVVRGNAVDQASGAVVKYGDNELDLVAHNVPPLVEEDYMPPMNSLSYRVEFFYTPSRTIGEFWQKQGEAWALDNDKFIGPGKQVRNTVATLIQPADTDEQKLRKLYAYVMTFENSDFTRSRSRQENKAEGLKEVKSTENILEQKRGSGDQLTYLFVAMVRAAGLKAYLMDVADRSRRIFNPAFLSFGQLDDLIAIVPLDGKEIYLDPGQRYCAFGQLAWQHYVTRGLREGVGGAALAATPAAPYSDSSVTRTADLTLEEDGSATGPVIVKYGGAPALRWRQAALFGDEASLSEALRADLEQHMPPGLEIRVTGVVNLTDFNKPLIVHYAIRGSVAAATGKRIIMPASLFEAGSRPHFTAARRELPVDMHYPMMTQDAVRISYPKALMLESAPPTATGSIAGAAQFKMSSKAEPGSVTLYRDVTVAHVFFTPAQYPELRTFYTKLDTGQSESLILTRATP